MTSINETDLSPAGQAYMYVYDSFAAGTDEVAQHLGVDRPKALRILRSIPSDLICSEEYHEDGQIGGDRARGRGKYITLTWQVYNTYDSEDRETALARAAQLGSPRELAAARRAQQRADSQWAQDKRERQSAMLAKATRVGTFNILTGEIKFDDNIQNTESKEDTMATKPATRKTAAKPAAKAKPAPKAPANREAKANRDAELTAAVVTGLAAGTKLGDLSKTLGVPAGRLAFLKMIHDVKPSDQIKGTAEQVAAKIVEARDSGKQSWGQIAARTRPLIPEPRVKAIYAETAGKPALGTRVRVAAPKPPKATKPARTSTAKADKVAASKAKGAAVAKATKARQAPGATSPGPRDLARTINAPFSAANRRNLAAAAAKAKAAKAAS